MTDDEATDLVSVGASPLLWRLVMHPAIPADLAAVQGLPARVLWQAEVMADYHDRVQRRAALDAANEAAIRKARHG